MLDWEIIILSLVSKIIEVHDIKHQKTRSWQNYT